MRNIICNIIKKETEEYNLRYDSGLSLETLLRYYLEDMEIPAVELDDWDMLMTDSVFRAGRISAFKEMLEIMKSGAIKSECDSRGGFLGSYICKNGKRIINDNSDDRVFWSDEKRIKSIGIAPD